MINCKRCLSQYVGETLRELRERFNEHRRTVDIPNSKSPPTAITDHFLNNNHQPNDIQLIPLETMQSNRTSIRKAREAHLIDKAQTLEPKGLNRREET